MTAAEAFRPLQLDDGPMIRARVSEYGFQSCMFNFVHLYTRTTVYGFELAELGESLVLRNTALDWTYYPVGPRIGARELSDLASAVSADAFHFAPEDLVMATDGLAERFEIAVEESQAEYVYDTAALARLDDKDLRRKREEAHRFWRLFPHAESRPLEAADVPACIDLARTWRAGKGVDDRLDHEFDSLRRSLELFDILGLSGMVLTLDERIVAFEVLSGGVGDMASCSFEKYDRGLPGCVAALRSAVARRLNLEGWPLMNFGRDLGLEHLRRAKQAYRPVALLRPHILRLRVR